MTNSTMFSIAKKQNKTHHHLLRCGRRQSIPTIKSSQGKLYYPIYVESSVLQLNKDYTNLGNQNRTLSTSAHNEKVVRQMKHNLHTSQLRILTHTIKQKINQFIVFNIFTK